MHIMGSHFAGKTVLEHLKAARAKGHEAMRDEHGLDAPMHVIAGADAARQSAVLFSILAICGYTLPIEEPTWNQLFGLFFFALLLWKTSRIAHLGWCRLERINRLIGEEKQEIVQNREEEKSELTEIYRAKGLEGELLTNVIDVLMADDNKVLGIMIEEELGMRTESGDHPLKQALSVGVGILLTGFGCSIGLLIGRYVGAFIASSIVVLLSAYTMAFLERLRMIDCLVWNLSILFLVMGSTYFLAQYITGVFL